MLFKSPPGALQTMYDKYIKDLNIDLFEVEELYAKNKNTFTFFDDESRKEWENCTDLDIRTFIAQTDWIQMSIGKGCIKFVTLKNGNILVFHDDTTAVILERNWLR